MEQPDFSALAAAMFGTEGKVDLEAADRLWTAVFRLPLWYVLMSPQSAMDNQPSAQLIEEKVWLLAFTDKEKLAHYANAAEDIQFKFPIGFKELEGIHSRTDFDLTEHQKFSGKKLQYFDSELNQNYVPYVIETSIGLDRMFLRVMSECLMEEALENGETRTVLRLPAALAPIKVAILPLVKKDGLPEKAREIMDVLKFVGRTFYQ